MAWNEPGGGRDPWGGGRRGGGAPDMDEMIRRLRAKFGGAGGGRGLAGGIGLIIGIIVLLWFASGFYMIDEQERGVVLRFGEYSHTTEAGLRWHVPWPVEKVEKVNVTRVRSAADRSLMLTQDENIVELELEVQYRVLSAEDFLFKVRDADTSLRQAMRGAIRDVVGQSVMDFIIGEGRHAVADQTRSILQGRLDDYQAGLFVMEVNLREARAPAPVQAAFMDAIKSREDQIRLQNEAEAYANDRVPRARGAAARTMAEAIGYREQHIARAQGDAARFTQLTAEYRKAPTVTRQRLYLETIEHVLAGSSKVILDVDATSPLLYLPLDQLARPRDGERGQASSATTPRPGGADTTTMDPRARDRGRR